MNKVQMINVHSPCRNCQDRHFRCHQECTEYQEYSKERAIVIERRRIKCDVNDGIRALYNRKRKSK